MIKGSGIRFSVIRAFIVVLCFKNWIFCASISLVRDVDDLNIDTKDLDPFPRDPLLSFASSKPFRQARRPTQFSRTIRLDNFPDGQGFFPSFTLLFSNNSSLGHNRPLFYPKHLFLPFYKSTSNLDLPFTKKSDNILGSSDFGVVKGSTYYAEEQKEDDLVSDSEPYSYIGSSSLHHKRKNLLPAFQNGGDFFAHFKDFADFTAPSKSFSEYYIVYVNKNAIVGETKQPVVKGPKNINQSNIETEINFDKQCEI